MREAEGAGAGTYEVRIGKICHWRPDIEELWKKRRGEGGGDQEKERGR